MDMFKKIMLQTKENRKDQDTQSFYYMQSKLIFIAFYIFYIFVRSKYPVQKTLLSDIYIIATNVGPFSLILLLQFIQKSPLFTIDGSLYVFLHAKTLIHTKKT